MGKDLVPFNNKKAVERLNHPAKTIISYGEQVITYVDGKYYAANVWGQLKQIEADMILEYKLGLRRGRNKR